MLHFVGLDNHLPWLRAKSRLDNEASLDHISAEGLRGLEHLSEINFSEGAILLHDAARA